MRSLLAAAETLLIEKGYHQTGIHEISDMAEGPVGMIYFYFKNKEGPLIDLMENIAYELRMSSRHIG